MKKDLKELNFEELKSELSQMGEKPFRATQIFSWMHKSLVCSVDDMTNISIKLRERLKEEYSYTVLELEEKQVSKLDGTSKYLFRLPDGNCVESVRMVYKHGVSVCISSQVGCRMGCKFCASTLGGLVRGLSAAEMLEQIYSIERDTGSRVDNIVIMGIGEPMDNYNEVVRFIRMITDERGLNISGRNITVSSCGLVPEIKRFAGEKLQVTLAISLHATTDEKRKEIMPVANKYSIEELMEAVDVFFETTGRRVSFEYALIAGVNDSEEDAKALAALAFSHKCHVNLIPVNPVTERGLSAPDRTHVLKFQNMLEKKGINATIRREMGRDIDGACGQLRRKRNAGHAIES